MPPSPINNSIFQSTIAVAANPGAGAFPTYTIPNNVRMHLLSLTYRFTADANVADRLHFVNVNNGTYNYHFALASGPVTAGEVIYMHWSTGAPQIDDSANHQHIISPLPSNLLLATGDILHVNTTNLQVGDTYVDIILFANFWTTD